MRITSKLHELNHHLLHCALIFTKQNGKPVCQIEDNYLCGDRGNTRKYRFMSLISDPNAHFTTLGEIFNNLVTGAGLPDYNLLHFLQTQLRDGFASIRCSISGVSKNIKTYSITY